MKNEEIKKAFDFELENTNEPLYSDEILKFVKNFHKKTKIGKVKFINSYQNNILDVISEIDFAFNDLLSNCKDAENRLYTIEELTPKNIKKREKLIKEIELLNNSKTQWNNDLKYFIKIGIQETKEAEVKEKHPKENNKFDEIFSNNGYELFSYILENHIAKKGIRGRINDLSFYYWSMFNSTPKYIHQRPEVFKSWFCETYEDNFNKLKTYEEAKDQKGNRKRHFQTSLDWFKNQK